MIIKEADKGSSIVIMDSEKYINTTLTLLQDNTYYEKINNYSQSKIKTKLSTLIQQFQQGLTQKETDYLTRFDCKTSNFYGLPKIHRSEAINEACNKSTSIVINIPHPRDLKMRPIVAGPSCEIHRFSNFIDVLLKLILQHIPSIIWDDLDFLNHLLNKTSKDSLLVSFDVINLYTSILHEYGIIAIQYWLEKFPNDILDRIGKEFIIEGIRFILQNNFFNFNENTYRQKSSTAMGTRVAPTFANLVMTYLEVQIYEHTRLKFGENFQKYLLTNWKCYLDDCFILWPHNIEQLTKFKNLINSINHSIQFTMEYNHQQLPFLDILIIKRDTEIEADVFFKPTDSKQYLLFSSCHPKHTKINIPFNLARRICTIASNSKTREKQLQELKTSILDRKYPVSLIKSGIEHAKMIRHPRVTENKKTLTHLKLYLAYQHTIQERRKHTTSSTKTCPSL
ncbi:uncharacterized protein LOC106875004 [Octopus bimaculoides]|uniref:uncharacterized protein LOC106875004 n=1 Tax=Octopus bimaculoides TaxID=37653 RepID=UPI00071D2991|nr:uncharacterized protein LOC106875004 [Octopus bimaculoides]|eukprot:XP_014778431.1 PREDICTED: uncharacterized protein LOC106875004 [Octopus bimaculoides]